MKILHLNTYAGNGGAGKACLRLNKALNDQGVESQVAVNFLFKPNPLVWNLSDGFFRKWTTAAGIILERMINKLFLRPVPIPFSIPFWGKDISHRKLVNDADVIHVHWINHAFLRPHDLSRLLALNKPLVWTFHDSNAFTGGCHVRYSCDHYQQECGNCPVLQKPHAHDLSHTIWTRKNEAYGKLNFSIIAPSTWMARSVASSKMLGSKHIVNIPNTLDTAVFTPQPKFKARQHLGVDPNRFILMSGFMPSRKDLHKGTAYLVEAIEIFVSEHPLEKDNMELVVFGNRNDKDVPDFPIKTTFLGTIAEEQKLACCYSAADVFLAPSLEDNLPNTVMESLACGTPVVAFTTGGIPDMIVHQSSGYLAEYKSAADLAAGIKWLFEHPDRESVNLNARRYVEDKFAEPHIARSHIQLYQSLLNNLLPKLSVITIVYNNVRDIERTLLSVINQDYQNIEYIVIDGASTDGTLQTLQSYQSHIDQLVSEKDAGIYDAMNKGLALASGDYVLFMNSGDEIYANDTVSKVFATAPDADIYYGETEMYDDSWQSLGQRRHTVPNQFTWRSFKYGMSISHQAIYIRRSLTEPYDSRYKLSADIDWIIKAAKKSSKIVNAERYVAKYLVGGMSKKKHRESLVERFRIFSEHYGLIPNLFNHGIIAARLLFYYLKNRRTND